MNKTSRRVVRGFLGIGVLFILFGFAQIVFFLGLDELGVVEVGNALGLGLLLWIAIALGCLFLVLGLLLAALLRKETNADPQVAGSPFNRKGDNG
jgi:type IV secretory pathway TrbD component